MKNIIKMFSVLIISFGALMTHALAEGPIIEWAPYQTIGGVTDQELMQASDALQSQFLEKQDGFIKRELLKGEGNNWVDLVHWESSDAADRAAIEASNSPICAEYFGLMVAANHEDPTQGVFRFNQMSVWK